MPRRWIRWPADGLATVSRIGVTAAVSDRKRAAYGKHRTGSRLTVLVGDFGSGSYVANRRREMVTMTVPGETEAGNAGMHPCRGIAWWAHRDDDRSAEALPRSSTNQIGSVDPDALKIPARRAEFTLTENARVPFHAEPGQWYYARLPVALLPAFRRLDE